MKIFLCLIAVLALAVGGCSSDDNAPAATTNPSNVANGGACTQGAQCQSGVCGYLIAKTCSVTAGVCVTQSTCSVQTRCPCGGGPAFSECDDGVYAGQAVTGNESCVPDAAVPVIDGGADAADADNDSSDGASGDSSDGASLDSGDAAD